MKILLSGGHLTPALALIDYAQAAGKDVEFVFVGRDLSQAELKQRSQEREEVERRGVQFIEFFAAKFTNMLHPLKALPELIHFVQSFFVAHRIFQDNKPDLFLSFGGYLAVPLALAAWVARIPIVTHEQTRGAGFANRCIAYLATKVAVSFSDSAKHFQKEKVVFTGNPLRRQVFDQSAKRPSWLPTRTQLPILYITGGNQGSQVVNVMTAQILPQLTDDWCVIHQCGNPTSVMNYRKVLEQAKQNLTPEQQERYVVREWITEEELAWIYQHADLVISRAGANTVQELLALGKVAILIPLPSAAQDEQTKNAEFMSKFGAAILLTQKELTPEVLLRATQQARKRLRSLQLQADEGKSAVKLDGDKALYEVIELLAST